MHTQTPAEIESKIVDILRLRPDLKDYEIAKRLRPTRVVSEQVAAVRATKFPTNNNAKVEPVSHVAKPRLRKLADFRQAHDIAQKIRNEVSILPPDSYCTEEELRLRCEVPVQNWRRYADLPEFSPHKFKLDGTTYWARFDTINEMKRITGRA